MNNNLISKEEILNEIVFSKREFFPELLKNALEYELLTLEEYAVHRDGMLSIIMQHAEELMEDVESDIENISNIIVSNHLYIVSLFLYNNFKPSDALIKIKNTSSLKLHAEAVRYFEMEISNQCIKFQKFESNVNEGGIIKESYNELVSNFKAILSYDVKFTEINKFIPVTKYLTMNYSKLNHIDIIEYIAKYSDAFMLEVKLRNKFSKKVMQKIRNEYFAKPDAKKKQKIKNEFSEKQKEVESIVTSKINKEIAKMEGDGLIVFEAEKKAMLQNAIEEELVKLDEQLEDSLNDMDILLEMKDNMLIETLVEFISTMLTVQDGITFPLGLVEKSKVIKELPKDKVFEALFKENNIIKFSEEEKVYLKENLIENI